MSQALWLIGFRAAGKTTVGRLLADRLGWRFLDLDSELESRAGCTILELVDREGLAEFRARERDLILEVCGRETACLVIATGGGFVDEPASFAAVAESGWPAAWLDPPAERLWERLSVAPDRQKIGHLTDFSAMEMLLKKRRPFYEKIATYRLETQDISECLASLQRLVLGGN